MCLWDTWSNVTLHSSPCHPKTHRLWGLAAQWWPVNRAPPPKLVKIIGPLSVSRHWTHSCLWDACTPCNLLIRLCLGSVRGPSDAPANTPTLQSIVLLAPLLCLIGGEDGGWCFLQDRGGTSGFPATTHCAVCCVWSEVDCAFGTESGGVKKA